MCSILKNYTGSFTATEGSYVSLGDRRDFLPMPFDFLFLISIGVVSAQTHTSKGRGRTSD